MTEKSIGKIIICLTAKVFTVKKAMTKGLILKAVKIDGKGMHTEMNFIEQDIKVLF